MRFPQTVPSKSSHGDSQWEVVSGLMAHFDAGSVRTPDELLRLDNVTVIRKEPTDLDAQAPNQAPVYRQGKSGPIGVPTGLVFVRFSHGAHLSEHQDALQSAGFVIEKLSTTKTTAAGWVRHQSGARSDSLREIKQLIKLKDAVVVEPQMLMPRASKSVR